MLDGRTSGMTTRPYWAYELLAPGLLKKPPEGSQDHVLKSYKIKTYSTTTAHFPESTAAMSS